MSDKGWKVRGESLQKITAILNDAKFITGNLGPLPDAIKARLGDANKNLVCITSAYHIYYTILSIMNSVVHILLNLFCEKCFGFGLFRCHWRKWFGNSHAVRQVLCRADFIECTMLNFFKQTCVFIYLLIFENYGKRRSCSQKVDSSFLTCFSTHSENLPPFSSNLKLTSANCFSLKDFNPFPNKPSFLALLAEGHRAIVMALCPLCVRTSVSLAVRACVRL